MTSRWFWALALALALAVAFLDGAARQREIDAVTDARVGAGLHPLADPTSPSGYRWGEHRLVLPESDSYHWLMQAEQSFARGAFRIRAVDYDDAPLGREVHWAGFERWWAQGLARLYGLAHPEVSAPAALERTGPWTNVLLLVAFLLAMTPVVALGFGSVPAALLALGSVAVTPVYEQFRVGELDHHAPVGLSCLLAVLFVAAGTMGRRTDRQDEPGRGRRWFIASGAAAGVGLWISAASAVPVLIALGLGALAAAGLAGGKPGGKAGSPRPRVGPPAEWFRLWGLAGGAASFCLYLLEYFPAHLGMRLEVNHPLYALALVGGGDLLARLIPRLAPPLRDADASARAPGDAPWLALDVAFIAAVPAAILLGGESTFRLGDPLIWTLHNRYINEFLHLAARIRPFTPAQIVAELNPLPLIGLPLAALIWSGAADAGRRALRRALALLMVAICAAYAYVLVSGLTAGSSASGALAALVVVALWFWLPLSRPPGPLAPAHDAALVVASVPAVSTLLMALLEARWLSLTATLWLVVLVVWAAVALDSDARLRPDLPTRASWALLGVLAFAVSPAVKLRAPFAPPNVSLVIRDASLWLRRRVGPDPAVVLASPTASTDLVWFGGFRAVGTLYWENLDGLEASAAICRAPDEGAARALLTQRGVTHVAVFGWDPGLEQLEASLGSGLLPSLPIQPMCMHAPGALPRWLLPLPYVPPRVRGFEHPVVQLFEVADVPPAVAFARLARWYEALHDPRMEQALARSLEAGPSVPGLAMKAQLQQASGDRSGFASTIARLQGVLRETDPIALEDRLEAVIALLLADERRAALTQLIAALDRADERELRRLPPERLPVLVDLARQAGLEQARPGVMRTAARLLEEGRG